MTKINRRTQKRISINKIISKIEIIASQDMKQTCGNITQLPKISIIRTSSNITPTSKSIHIHHKNNGIENHRKMKTLTESEIRGRKITDVKDIETRNEECLRRNGETKKRKIEEKIRVRKLEVRDGFDLDQSER